MSERAREEFRRLWNDPDLWGDPDALLAASNTAWREMSEKERDASMRAGAEENGVTACESRGRA
jgi:hypothetical protein